MATQHQSLARIAASMAIVTLFAAGSAGAQSGPTTMQAVFTYFVPTTSGMSIMTGSRAFPSSPGVPVEFSPFIQSYDRNGGDHSGNSGNGGDHSGNGGDHNGNGGNGGDHSGNGGDHNGNGGNGGWNNGNGGNGGNGGIGGDHDDNGGNGGWNNGDNNPPTSTVPEPSTMLMLGTGLVGLVGVVKGRK